MSSPRRPGWALGVLALGLAALTGSGCTGAPLGGALPAPPLGPPRPPVEVGLTPERVVAIATTEEDPAEAIRRLDGQPFAFDLDRETLAWLRERVPPDVHDYLVKRSRVDWDTLHGVDPGPPRLRHAARRVS